MDTGILFFFFQTTDEGELFIHFLKQQNRFLAAMMDEALNTVLKGVEDIKQLQLTQTHEVKKNIKRKI